MSSLSHTFKIPRFCHNIIMGPHVTLPFPILVLIRVPTKLISRQPIISGETLSKLEIRQKGYRLKTTSQKSQVQISYRGHYPVENLQKAVDVKVSATMIKFHQSHFKIFSENPNTMDRRDGEMGRQRGNSVPP